jgi:hypothetical protein
MPQVCSGSEVGDPNSVDLKYFHGLSIRSVLWWIGAVWHVWYGGVRCQADELDELKTVLRGVDWSDRQDEDEDALHGDTDQLQNEFVDSDIAHGDHHIVEDAVPDVAALLAAQAAEIARLHEMLEIESEQRQRSLISPTCNPVFC